MNNNQLATTNIISNSIKMGAIPNEWRRGEAKNITLSLTQECNLRCTYCYMTHKNNEHRMSFDMAKKIVDYILENRGIFDSPAVIWEFIGGEPLLEIDLVDQISEYIKLRMYMLNHPWKDNYVFFMCSNGLLYSTPKVQEYIKKNRAHISIGISIDGNKEKHDLSRIKLDGSGSYDDVMKNVPLWLKQFPGSMTKATFAHNDLPYLKDSIISLWNNGIKTVAANVVFEDVWEKDDPIIFEDQLKQLADYIIENEIWDDMSVRFFSPQNGFALDRVAMDRPYCGSGRMLAVDDSGNFYPCIRFLDFCQNNNKSRTIGNVYDGLDLDRVRPFYGLSIGAQSTKKCIECNVASGCANCTGNDFDDSSEGTIFYRATYLCNMHKASVRANKYLWKKYTEKTGKISERSKYLQGLLKDKEWVNRAGRFMYFITSDMITPHCNYSPTGERVMSESIFKKGLEFCYENDYVPIFLGNINDTIDEYLKCNVGFIFDRPNKNNRGKANDIDIFNSFEDINLTYENNSNIAILNITCEMLSTLYDKVTLLANKYRRININITDKQKIIDSEKLIYKNELEKIMNFIIREIKDNNKFIEINVLTDILFNDVLVDCKAGKNSLALAPDGKIYPCPAFYFSNQKEIATLNDPLEKIVLKECGDKLPLCGKCDALHCKVCRHMNINMTGELNYPPKVQCETTYIEREISVKLSDIFSKDNLRNIKHYIKPVEYLDPQNKYIFSIGRITESSIGKEKNILD